MHKLPIVCPFLHSTLMPSHFSCPSRRTHAYASKIKERSAPHMVAKQGLWAEKAGRFDVGKDHPWKVRSQESLDQESL